MASSGRLIPHPPLDYFLRRTKDNVGGYYTMTITYYSTLITLSVWPNHQSLVSRTILQGQKVITLDVCQFFYVFFVLDCR